MSHFRKIAEVNVSAAIAELDARPDLWNDHAMRRVSRSPHRETDDIWVRYRHPSELRRPEDYLGSHESVPYPAWHALPALHPIVDDIERRVGSVRRGGILITRIPPGGTVYPHHDRGSWHAEYYDMKVWLPLRGNDRCVNRVLGEASVWKPGEAWHHDNLVEHSVENRGDTERVCLIMCFRCGDV